MEVGLRVRPHHHLPAIPARPRIRTDADVRPDVGAARVLHIGIRAVEVAADVYRSATRIALRRDAGAVDQSDLIAQQLHRAAGARRAVGFDCARREQRPALGLHRDRAPLRPARFELAARIERDVLLRLEEDLAVLADHGAVRGDKAALFDHAGEDADAASLGDQLADVDGAVLRRSELHPQLGPLRIDEFHALARCEDDFALGTGDDAVILDVGRDEVDEAAARSGDGAAVDDLARAARVLQLESSCKGV